MSVKVHEPVCEDSAQDLYFWFDHFLGDQIKDEWASAGDAGGSAVVVDAQTGGIVRITTDNDANDAWRLDWGNIKSLLVASKVTLEVRAKPNQATYIRIWLELRFNDANRIYFHINEAAGGATNWFIRCADGGAATSQDSGVTLDTDYHIFRIEAFPTGEVHFYIDGDEVTNSPISTNITAQYLQPSFFLLTRTTTERTMDIDYVVVRQNR